MARVLKRGEGAVLRPGQRREERGEVILGTPLYVSQVHRKHVELSRITPHTSPSPLNPGHPYGDPLPDPPQKKS